METYLPPIDKPRGLMMKLAYYFTRKQFGKVMTPLMVHSARMPMAFGLFAMKIGKLDKKLVIPRELILIVRERVADINGCLFCMDLDRWAAMRSAMDIHKFDAVAQYASSPLFSEKERAALDYATELTATKHVATETFARLARFYSEREICDIVWLVASEHLYNITNVGLNIHSDNFCEINRH